MKNKTDEELRNIRGDDGQLILEAQREMSYRGQPPLKPPYVSLQSQFDSQALDMMPLIVAAIKASDEFGANQIRCSAIQAICNFTPCLDDMTGSQIENKSLGMLNYFVGRGWITEHMMKKILRSDQ